MSLLKKHHKGIFICLLGALFYCYEYLLRIIPGVMQTELREAYGHLSAGAFGTLTAYYYFAYTPMQLPAGIMMDRMGPHKLLSVACFLCAFGSFLFTDVSNFNVAAMGRFLVGFGSAFAFVGVLKLANSWLPKRYLSVVAGMVTTLGMVGAIVGQVGMTYVVETQGYQYVLWFSAFIGLFFTALLLLFLRDNHKETDAHSIPVSIFLRQVLEVIVSSQIWLIGLIGSLLYLSLSLFAEVWGKSYLMAAHHLSSTLASESVSAVFLGWAIGGPVVGFLSERTNRPLNIIFVGALGATFMISVVLFVPHLSFLALCLLLFLYGLFCSSEVLVFVLARDAARPHLVGTVLAVVNMIIMIGGVIFQPVVGKLLDHFWDGRMDGVVRVYSVVDYQLVLSFLPLAAMLVAILVFFIRTER